MIIFLYGPDAYRLKEARQNIIEEYKKKHSSGVNISHFDFSNNYSSGELLNVIKSSSFFNEHKLAIISGTFSKKNSAERINTILNDYDLDKIQDATFMFVEPSLEKDLTSVNKDLFKSITAGASMVKVFDSLEGQALDNWIKNEFKIRGCTVQNQVSRELVDLIGNDSWALVNEIEKLCAYKSEGEITTADISSLISSSLNLNIFDLVDAIGSRDRNKAFSHLYLNLAIGRDPYYLMSLIAGQIRNIITVKDLIDRNESQSAIIKKTGLHPFVVKKTLAQTAKFTNEDLRKKYDQIQKADVYSKNGRGELKEYLYGLVLN